MDVKSIMLSEKKSISLFLFLLKYTLLVMLLQLSHFFPPLFPLHPTPSSIPSSFSSCPWVIHTSSLVSPFPILFLTSPYSVPTNYASHSLYLPLPLAPHPLPADNPPCDLHFCYSLPVLVVCLVCFCFFRFSC